MRSLLLLVAVAGLGCSKAPPQSDSSSGSVPPARFVTDTDGGHAARSISVVLDQQPAGSRSLLVASASEIVRTGIAERFAQPNVACPNQLVAGCLITNCTSLKDVNDYPYGTVTSMALGRVALTGASRTETLESDGGTKTRVVQRATPLFGQGELIKVSAGATEVTPAFQQVMVVPRPVELLAPQVDDVAVSINIKRELPLQIRWAALPAGAPERVAVAVSDNVRTATCRFDASTGLAKVPVDVLSMLAPGPGFLTVHTVWAHDEAVNGWLVSVFARHVATQADGGTAKFPTLEIE